MRPALGHHSPAVCCLVAVGLAFAAEVAAFTAWNVWENRAQILDLAVRRLNR